MQASTKGVLLQMPPQFSKTHFISIFLKQEYALQDLVDSLSRTRSLDEQQIGVRDFSSAMTDGHALVNTPSRQGSAPDW